MHVLERIKPGARIAGPEAIELPAGYRIEPVATSLNYPTSVTWDPAGDLLIAESGFPYGRATQTEPRILRHGPGGLLRPLARLDRPIGDIAFHGGALFVSQRGRISVVEAGRSRDLIGGLPSWGLHANNAMAFDGEGHLYFGQGTVSNAGIVGPAELEILYRSGHPGDHDIPGGPVTLAGHNLPSANPVTHETRGTGAFSPWGVATAPGQRLAGPGRGQAASGAIMQAGRDGGDLRVYAWGLRNPFGLAFGPEGRLYVTNQGARPLLPRPVAGDPDALWAVEEGAWYGWPDYAGGRPVTAPGHRQPNGEPRDLLLANHDELLKGRQAPPGPLATLGLQAGSSQLDFPSQPAFGFAGQAFVAQFGPLLPPGSWPQLALPAGHRIVRVDLRQGLVSDFAVNRSRMPASDTGNNGGLERPLQARFGPDGNLYIVDLGVVEYREEFDDWVAIPATGIVWRVTHASPRA